MLVNLLNTFSTAELICLAVLFFSLLVQLYFYLRFYTAVFRHKRRIKKGKIKPIIRIRLCGIDALGEYIPLDLIMAR